MSDEQPATLAYGPPASRELTDKERRAVEILRQRLSVSSWYHARIQQSGDNYLLNLAYGEGRLLGLYGDE